MTHDVIVALAVLGVVGQVLAGLLILIALAALVGARGPLRAIRRLLWGYELWAAFVVAAIATGGSLFFSEVAHFVPCELCWYQRICMYPLSILTLLIAYYGDHRAILKRYVRTKKLKVEARVLDFIGPDSSRGRKAMIALAPQNRAFNFSQLLYTNQGTENTGWLNDAMVGQAVSSIPGVRVHDALNLQSAGSVAKLASAFDAAAVVNKVSGTPTLFVGKSGTNGKQVPLTGPTDAKSLVTALDTALNS
jgi:hypothetical protein